MLRCAEGALARLRELPDDSQVLVFSHGQFIHAVRMIVLHPEATDKQRMLHFWRADGMPAVQNAELVELHCLDVGWQLGSSLCEAGADPKYPNAHKVTDQLGASEARQIDVL